MKKNILYTLALLSIFASCAKTELPHFGGENDPNAVVISPSVAVLSSKSNPLGDDEAQTKFNEGDVITIKDLSDSKVYTYKLTNGSWKSTDGKCLLWHSESLNIEASYGSKGEEDRGVSDQSDAEGIASADYMTYSGTVQRPDGSNELSFTLKRQQALVTVVIKSYGDQYNPDRDFISSLSICDLTPYIRDADGNHTLDNGTVGYKYSAIVPGGILLRINYNVGGDSRIVTNPNGNFFCEAGNSYTINLRVGKDKIEVGDITVSYWGSTNWDDAEAKAYPYVTFSAASEQKFNMTFNGFSLGENEYFEYSVGDGSWTSFTGTVENVAFGGSNGDLRLRGKSIKGTAEAEHYYTNISFTTADVPVYCTGDIRTLIDYEDYWSVSTAEAKFINLFMCNPMLMTAPELPATDLATYCYSCMFQACTSLTTSPVLPAENLAEGCYEYMFSSCTALSSVTMLAPDVSTSGCLDNWLFNAGTSATSRTLTLENDDVYYTISANPNYLPDNWKRDKATINYKNFTPYVTFSADSDQMFNMTFSGFSLGAGEYFEYSVGGNAWTRFNGTVSNVAFGGSNGDLRLRGKSSHGTANNVYSYSTIGFSTGAQVKCTGDIRTLIDYENYTGDISSSARFVMLFKDNTWLTTAPALPAMDLATNCYLQMFERCTSLTEAPELPATTLAVYCYANMFEACTSLTKAPELLPATTLAEYCCAYMFYNCTSLTKAPALPATELKESCYANMFYNCTQLSEVTMLATNVSASGCLTDWLKNAGTIPDSRTLTVASEDAYNSIVGNLPDNWKSGQATIQYQNN